MWANHRGSFPTRRCPCQLKGAQKNHSALKDCSPVLSPTMRFKLSSKGPLSGNIQRCRTGSMLFFIPEIPKLDFSCCVAESSMIESTVKCCFGCSCWRCEQSTPLHTFRRLCLLIHSTWCASSFLFAHVKSLESAALDYYRSADLRIYRVHHMYIKLSYFTEVARSSLSSRLWKET